jgi:hypothetical protein
MLTYEIAPKAHPFRPDCWEEKALTLSRDGEAVHNGRLYRTRDTADEPFSRWHLINCGRFFDEPEDAGEYLVENWDREPTADELWTDEVAERTYQAQLAYACGERD